MKVQSEVLRLLEKNRGQDMSGQELADKLGVSRAAVWKAINKLKQEGYKIQAVNNRGYRLLEDSDVLSAEEISRYLAPEYKDNKVVVYKITESTNLEVKKMALEGAAEGLLVLAEQQTGGRGRRGRQFYSPEGTGIYMSVLFRPTAEQSQNIVRITTATSVAICRSIRKIFAREPGIKWVNDVYLNGKKICGILTEAVSDFESGQIDTVVVGIGINYREPEGGFPEDIRGIAGAVCNAEDTIPRNQFIAEVYNQLMDVYHTLSAKEFMEEYKQWSNVIGKWVRFSTRPDPEDPEGWVKGIAVDIDEEGGLVVEKEDGTRTVLRTGEISLRIEENV